MDDLYNDYLQARYSANALELEKYIKLARVEPYKHLVLGDLSAAPNEVKMKKLWYADWILSKADPEILLAPVDKLQEEFAAYCDEQEAKAQEKVKEMQAAMQQEPNGDPKGGGEGGNPPGSPEGAEGEQKPKGEPAEA
jgi:hypothetical protein